MRSIFTIHAGEYLVGSYVEENFKGFNVWVPSKDTGVDILLTDAKNKKTVSLQVKYSKDFLEANRKQSFHEKLKSLSWFTLNRDKIKQSSADFWIFVLYSFNQKNEQYVIIEPEELLKKLTKIHDNKTIQSYLWVIKNTKKDKCWETRGLNKEKQDSVLKNEYNNKDRDFTKHLNNWKPIMGKLK